MRSEAFGAAIFAGGSIGADTILGGEGSDMLQDFALQGLLGSDAFCCNGADVILGQSDDLSCDQINEIVTGGLGDEVLFGELAPDPLVDAIAEWAGGAGEDVLVGEQDMPAVRPSFTIGAWTDGAEPGRFAAILDDLQAGRVILAGGGADTLDLRGLAA